MINKESLQGTRIVIQVSNLVNNNVEKVSKSSDCNKAENEV